MHAFGTYTLLLGMAVAALAQVIGAALVFRASFVNGVLALTIPGYLLLALRRQGSYRPVVGIWVLGIMGMVIGTIVLS